MSGKYIKSYPINVTSAQVCIKYYAFLGAASVVPLQPFSFFVNTDSFIDIGT